MLCAKPFFPFVEDMSLAHSARKRVSHPPLRRGRGGGGAPRCGWRNYRHFFAFESARASHGARASAKPPGRTSRTARRRPMRAAPKSALAGPPRKRAAGRQKHDLTTVCYKVLLREMPSGVTQERNPSIQRLTAWANNR